MRSVPFVLFVAGCVNLKEMPPDLPCREAAFAIAAATERCTGDVTLAEARVTAFEEDYVCIEAKVTDPEMNNPAVAPLDWFDCAFTIRNMPCELVEDYGDDLESYLQLSDACTWVVARRDGENLGAPR